MADNGTQTLFEYLTKTQFPPMIVDPTVKKAQNTRSPAYPLPGVSATKWTRGIQYNDIMESRYAPILFNTRLKRYPPITPTKNDTVCGEPSVAAQLNAHFIPAVKRSLRVVEEFPPGHTRITPGTGDTARFKDSDANPDYIGHTDTPSRTGREARLPGDVKCSWKWHSTWQASPGAGPNRYFQEIEFRAVCAQINFYMNTGFCRYGYVITDAELVPFRKLDKATAGEIQYGPGIPLDVYDSSGLYTRGDGKVTALLALWYLHMLASDDEEWHLHVDSDPEVDTDPSGDYTPRN